MDESVCNAEGCQKPLKSRGYCSMHSTRLSRHGNLEGKRPLGRTIEDRFWSHVVKSSDPDGCWTWDGARQQPFGYGMFGVTSKRIVGAHRFSYQLRHGAIPEGLQVCHHCDNPPCVRPDHLFLGTAVDNSRDMVSKGRANFPKRRTHCPQGHPYDEANTVIRKDGYQSCRICRTAWSRASAARRKTRRQAERGNK